VVDVWFCLSDLARSRAISAIHPLPSSMFISVKILPFADCTLLLLLPVPNERCGTHHGSGSNFSLVPWAAMTMTMTTALSATVQAISERTRDEALLQSWNAGSARKSMTGFVRAVTTAGSPQIVKPGERIALSDNDGTL